MTDEKLKEIKKQVESILREHRVMLTAKLHITEDGLLPIVTLIPIDKPVIEEIKTPIVIPK